MLPGSSSVLHLFVSENLNLSSKLFFACPDKRSGPPVDTASMCIPSDGQVCIERTRIQCPWPGAFCLLDIHSCSNIQFTISIKRCRSSSLHVPSNKEQIKQ